MSAFKPALLQRSSAVTVAVAAAAVAAVQQQRADTCLTDTTSKGLYLLLPLGNKGFISRVFYLGFMVNRGKSVAALFAIEKRTVPTVTMKYCLQHAACMHAILQAEFLQYCMHHVCKIVCNVSNVLHAVCMLCCMQYACIYYAVSLALLHSACLHYRMQCACTCPRCSLYFCILSILTK